MVETGTNSPTDPRLVQLPSQGSTDTYATLPGGVKIKLSATKKIILASNTALYTKADREKLPVEKLNELFERAIRTSQTKYELLDLKINDPEKLNDTYNLEMALDTTKLQHIKYDMHDVFTIIKVIEAVNGTKSYETVDLYRDYALVTEQEVAESNEWYATETEDPNNKWFLQNLKLTHEHLINNADTSLVTKVNETYLRYEIQQRGGPLFMKIMLDLLQNNSEEAAEYLITVVKKIKITEFDGENVEKVVSLIRGAVSRLQNLKDNTGNSALPKDFGDSLVLIFQTSSCMEFNSLFEHYARTASISEFETGTTTHAVITKVLRFAETQYRKLYSTGKWSGIDAKAGATAFMTTTRTCFNCGGSHLLNDCTKARNVASIESARKRFQEMAKGGRGAGRGAGGRGRGGRGTGGPNKWAVPTDAERKSKPSGRRTIDGKQYYYHNKTHRWRLVDTDHQAQAKIAAAVPAPAPAEAAVAIGVPIPPTAATASTPAEKEVAITNATKTMETAFRGLLANFD